MRKFSDIALSAALLVVVVYFCSCGTSVIDPYDPILPAPEQQEGVADPVQRTITVAKEGVTITVQHWSKTRLNRKYTTVDMRSPFYYQESWEQSFQKEVFHVTIKNDNPGKLVVLFKETVMTDEREYVYRPIVRIDDFKNAFMMKQMMDLRTKRGLQIAREIMLSEVLGPRDEVPPNSTRAGFIPYTTPSRQAEKIWLKIVMDKEPEMATAAYERLEFNFDFIQDLVLLPRQPPVKR
jgi:hypothetical protein